MNLSPTALLAAAASTFVPAAHAQEFWAPAGPPLLIDEPSLSHHLVFDGAGVPYVAFQDKATQAKSATVMRFVNGAWETLGDRGAATKGRAWYNQMAFDGQGRLLLASRDYGYSSIAAVTRFDFSSGDWELVGQDASPGEAHYTMLALSPQDEPWLVYSDRTGTPLDRARVRRFTQGSWVDVGPPALSQGRANYTSLRFAPNGDPYVAFTDLGVSAGASVLRWDGASWQALPHPGLDQTEALQLALAISPSGQPHVAWIRHNQGLFVEAYSGGQWSLLGGGSAAAPGHTAVLESEAWRQWLSLDFDASGRALVGYQSKQDDGRYVVRRFEGGSWSTLGGGFLPHGRSDYPAMAVAPDGQPWVLFREGPYNSPPSVAQLTDAPTEFCAAKVTSIGCEPQTTATGNASLSGGSLRLDASQVLPGGVGVLLISLAPTRMELPAGRLCLADPVQRLHPQGTGAGGGPCSGTLSHTLYPAELDALTGGVPATLFAQWWYRGPSGTGETTSWLASALAFGVAP